MGAALLAGGGRHVAHRETPTEERAASAGWLGFVWALSGDKQDVLEKKYGASKSIRRILVLHDGNWCEIGLEK